MERKNNNPFTKKKSIFDHFNKKNKISINNTSSKTIEEKSNYIVPGDPYTITSKLIYCTPVIPILYKLDSLMDFYEYDNNNTYKEMYEEYIKNKYYIDSQYLDFIYITMGIKIEININRYNDSNIINDLNEFITHWSSSKNLIKIFSYMKNDNIECINILINGSLYNYKNYFKTYYNGNNIIDNNIISSIASSNKIYKNIIFDENNTNYFIDSVFTDDSILSQIDAEQYEESDEKKYNDKFYTLTKSNNISIIYIDDYINILNDIEEYFGKNTYKKLNNIVLDIYDIFHIVFFVYDNINTILSINLHELIKNYLNKNSNNKFINEFVIDFMVKYMNLKINDYNEYDLSLLFSDNMDSYSNVDEVIEEEEIL